MYLSSFLGGRGGVGGVKAKINPKSLTSKNEKTPDLTELGKFFFLMITFLHQTPRKVKVRKVLLLFTYGAGFLNGRKCRQDDVQLLQAMLDLATTNIFIRPYTQCQYTHAHSCIIQVLDWEGLGC